LSIDWTAGDGVDVVSKHNAVKGHLLTRFPSLRRLWLCDWKKSALLWSQTALGTETLRVCERTYFPVLSDTECDADIGLLVGTLSKDFDAMYSRRMVFTAFV
jgi:hypothetical protein